MNQCTGTPAERFLERYIQGTLPPSEQEEFEAHYFDCVACLAQVEALQAVTAGLARQPVKTSKPLFRWPMGLSTLGAMSAVAAMLVIGFISYRMFKQRTEPAVTSGQMVAAPQPSAVSPPASPTASAPTVSVMADLALPAYQPASLRGTETDSAFDTGMKAYAMSDCRQAIAKLSSVEVSDSNALAAQFYTGLCQMREKDFAAANATLRRVTAAGDSPQQEAAIYYLAQIALAKNDAPTARRYLIRTVALHGDFEPQARAELAELPTSAGHP